MYKHQSYNNVIEKKLEQLPAPDTAGLWSGMEAMLDQHLPQKKRRPAVLAWLFTHKTWMMAALFVLAAGGTSVAYLTGRAPLAANQPSAPNQTAPETKGIGTGTPAAATPANDATDPVTAFESTTKTTRLSTANKTAAPTAAAAQPTTSFPTARPTLASKGSSPAATGTNQQGAGSRKTIPALSVTRTHEAAPVIIATSPDEANLTTSRSAAYTAALAPQEKIVPSVNPAAIIPNTAVLQELSQHLAAGAAAAPKSGHYPDEKGLYAGLTVGMDLSSVQFGSVRGGRNQGLIVGYALNRFWSVESGLLWDKKKYYTDGDHYKPDGYTPTPGVTLVGVEGVNSLYEWPVTVRYNIVARKNKLFALAGVSSYFMRSESYDLSYVWNGQQNDQYDRYKNATRNWLSVANLSLGYTYRLGRAGSLRLEPYLKLPLRELGAGNMRVTSTGLNIGFTRTLTH